MIIGPPGDPTANLNLPSGPNTIVGDMAESGCLPGAGALATGFPSRTGSKEKSVSWLSRMKPFTIISDPIGASTVVVIETTSPRLSTMDMWLVPGCSGERCGANFLNDVGGIAGHRLAHVLRRIDQRRALREIGRVEQAAHRHGHERRIAQIFAAVGIGETARLREQMHAAQRIHLQVLRGKALEHSQDLQDRDAARARRPHRAEFVAAIVAAHRRALARLVVARDRRASCARD